MIRDFSSSARTREVLEFLQSLCEAELLRPVGQMVLFYKRHGDKEPAGEKQRLLLDRVGTVLAWMGGENGPLEKSARLLEALALVREIDLALARRSGAKLRGLVGRLNELLVSGRLEGEIARLAERLALVVDPLAESAWDRLGHWLCPRQELTALQIGLLLRLGWEAAAGAVADIHAPGAAAAARMIRHRLRLAAWVLIMAVYRQGLEELCQLAQLLRGAVEETTAASGR